jgi:hypothetical protein
MKPSRHGSGQSQNRLALAQGARRERRLPGIHHPTRDLIWASETALGRPESQWWMLASEGTWQHLTYLTRQRRVLGHGKTLLDAPSIDPVFAALSEEEFFDLAFHYPPVDIQIEGDIVVVAARLGGRSHRVVARPPTFWPEALERIVGRLRRAGAAVADRAPALGYWRADQMDSARAERVRRRGMVLHRSLETTTPMLTKSLRRALADPGVWVAIEREEIDQARELAGDRSEFVVEGPTASLLVELWHGA